ncbi:MAG: PilZ domain-containing protein [Pyrinomonadaceae bacterium]|nr:PilZ domain-containing protein [Pyrinomonadaceae bacterium]
MNDEMNRGGSTPHMQRPRNPRVPVSFTVELEGETTGGEAFRVRAEAVRISRAGATVISDIQVAAGTSVRITPPAGQSLEAQVNGVWMDDADGLQRVGIKLLDPNGWFAE